jgi:predicted Holliday junction resolvase-like endonuclease
MITFIIIVLSLTIVGLGFAYKEITSLRKEVDEIHNRISVTDQQTHLRINEEINLLESKIKEVKTNMVSLLNQKLDDEIDDVKKLIPPTNDELLKEVQQMRDDFFALRQYF